MAAVPSRHTAAHSLELDAATIEMMRQRLPDVADAAVEAIITEVPSYAGALTGEMGTRIRTAVQIALGGFISLASRTRGADPRSPTAPAVEGAYQLGRGEARSGRTMEALLAAYRVGARVCWHEISVAAVAGGAEPKTLAEFAGLVFAYIDELSAASAAGHSDELTTTGRVRERLLEQLATVLLAGGTAEEVATAAEPVDWKVPEDLTAVLVPDAQVRPVLTALPAGTLTAAVESADATELEGWTALLVPDLGGRGRPVLLRALQGRAAVAGPARPVDGVRSSYRRAVRGLGLGLAEGSESVDTDAHLARLLLSADPDMRADLREHVLEPLAGQRPATAEKLAETLRAWVLHQGRREDIANELFVHPQTVRYRMAQLRDLYGDRLGEADFVRDATIALA